MSAPFEIEVLLHTSLSGRYVTSDPRVLAMGERGLLYSYGPQALAGGDHYLTLTKAGRDAINEWKAAQPPPPKVKKRRKSEVFESWQAFTDACGHMSFAKFYREVWPTYKFR